MTYPLSQTPSSSLHLHLLLRGSISEQSSSYHFAVRLLRQQGSTASKRLSPSLAPRTMSFVNCSTNLLPLLTIMSTHFRVGMVAHRPSQGVEKNDSRRYSNSGTRRCSMDQYDARRWPGPPQSEALRQQADQIGHVFSHST
jgi:hypothetical protein